MNQICATVISNYIFVSIRRALLYIFSPFPYYFQSLEWSEETSRIGDISMTTNDAQRVDIAEKCKGYLRAGRVHDSPAEFADGGGGGGW